MDSQRNLLIIALLFVSFMIWQAWEQDRSAQSQKKNIPTPASLAGRNTTELKIPTSFQGKQITVKTDLLEVTINTQGGDIEQALLLAYLKDLKSKEPFQLLETTPEFVYQAQSGISGHDGPDNPANGMRPLYKVEKDSYILANNQNSISIPMVYTDPVGNRFTKTFTLKRGEYSITVDYSIHNIGTKPLEVSIFGQLKQSINLPLDRIGTTGNFALQSFRGAAYSTPSSKYVKYKFDRIANNENLNIVSESGWIAMLQQHFVTAWIPSNNGADNNFYTSNLGNDVSAIGYRSRAILVQPSQTATFSSILWIGPEIQEKMAAVAPYLDLTVDYGWLWFISQPLFRLLKLINTFLGNWGFSIVVITFIVRGIMYPLTKAQYTSIAKIRMLQPKIQAMQERLGHDKQRQSHELMALYKAEKVNPLGGCVPLLIQMPIFLGLYYMLMNSVELRHAPFAFWIRDLSAQDPYYILPLLMGITMFFIQRMSPASVTDPIQKKIMTFMPVIFTVFFLWFPSGLVLYYIISNLVTIIQQQIIYRGLERRGLYRRDKDTHP